MKYEVLKNIKPLSINTKQEWDFKAPENMPQHFFNGILCGSRGSGKSYLSLLLMENLKNAYQKFYCISPTRPTDRKMKEFFIMLEEQGKKVVYYDNLTPAILEEMQDDMKNDLYFFRQYLKIKKIIDILNTKGVRGLTDEMLGELVDLNLFDDSDDEEDDEKMDMEFLYRALNSFPQYIRNNHPPASIVLVDDLYGCPLLSKSQGTNPFIQYWIKHRHFYASNLVLVQSISGVPRAIRGNTTLWCVFGLKSEKEKKVLHEEVDNVIPSKIKFTSLINAADQEKHGFLYMDLVDTKNPDIRLTLDKKVSL